MIKREYTIKWELGMHARPSATLMKCLCQFNLEKADMIYVTKDGETKRGSMKSIIDLLTICVPGGTPFEVELQGRDEQKAADYLEKFFSFETEHDLYMAHNPDLCR